MGLGLGGGFWCGFFGGLCINSPRSGNMKHLGGNHGGVSFAKQACPGSVCTQPWFCLTLASWASPMEHKPGFSFCGWLTQPQGYTLAKKSCCSTQWVAWCTPAKTQENRGSGTWHYSRVFPPYKWVAVLACQQISGSSQPGPLLWCSRLPHPGAVPL
jgi:hypothetical protein